MPSVLVHSLRSVAAPFFSVTLIIRKTEGLLSKSLVSVYERVSQSSQIRVVRILRLGTVDLVDLWKDLHPLSFLFSLLN